MSDFDLETIQKITELTERCHCAEAERDALAAHVEATNKYFLHLVCNVPLGAGVLRRLEELRTQAPATSLARLIAEKQAEALEEVKRNLPGGRGVAWQLLSKRINELRR